MPVALELTESEKRFYSCFCLMLSVNADPTTPRQKGYRVFLPRGCPRMLKCLTK